MTKSDANVIECYRPVSKFVCPTLVCSLLTSTAIIDFIGLWFVVPTIIFGSFSIVEGKKYGLAGPRLALCSLLFSFLILLYQPMYVIHLFLKEAPRGYQRVSFEETLESDGFDSFVGKKICLKGHTLTSTVRGSLKSPTDKKITH